MLLVILVLEVLSYLLLVHIVTYHYYTTSDGSTVDKYNLSIRLVGYTLVMILIACLYFLGYYNAFILQFVLIVVVIIYNANNAKEK